MNLDGNTLGVEAAECIGEALKKHPELKRALWNNLFTGRLKSEIPLALKSMGNGIILSGAQLSVLDCSDNALGPNGMIGLVDLIKSKACYALNELKLNNCGLGIDGGKMLAKSLLECHKNSLATGKPLSLKVFIAGRNRLENPGATALAEVFKTLKSLEEIAMPQNGIYHVGMAALSEAFQHNPKMRILNLNDNTIGPKGCVALQPAIEKMQGLVELNFGDCLIKTDGAAYIGNALSDGHPNLEVLNLEFNEIGARGGRIIGVAMENKTKLKSLMLNGNKFGEEFCEELIESLKISNHENVLGSMSGDEGDDSEDEAGSEEEDDDDDDDYEDVDEEEEEDYDDDGESRFSEDPNAIYELETTVDQTSFLDNTLDKSVTFTGQQTLPQTIQTFMTIPHPSESLFKNIEDKDKIEAFRNFLSVRNLNIFINSQMHIKFKLFKLIKLC